ncbi:hypothetical protein DLD82_14830 [Methanospirillum stamsii]|uniref:Uncharacterized protein n=1 Tax=Methanospirillum stamsii TaxID=1277351 RepID=A0A2V2N2M2_9EURY|nr:hypothetical protein DLD82_14830 [Methanospirillum stamsii]
MIIRKFSSNLQEIKFSTRLSTCVPKSLFFASHFRLYDDIFQILIVIPRMIHTSLKEKKSGRLHEKFSSQTNIYN